MRPFLLTVLCIGLAQSQFILRNSSFYPNTTEESNYQDDFFSPFEYPAYMVDNTGDHYGKHPSRSD